MHKKELGQYFTPLKTVSYMLNKIKYNINNPDKVLKKHIIDTSCGDGAFILEIISIYCCCGIKKGMKNKEIVKDIETYIHGIEIDKKFYDECIKGANYIIRKILKDDNLRVDFDIVNDDFFNRYKELPKMDYVVGNPPYIRLGKIENSEKYLSMFKYIDNPNGDLFCLFTEAGLELLNDTGEMIYIIPSSFNNIKSASKLRRYIYGNNLLKYYDEILDENLFNKALVYVSIYTFSKNKKDDAVFYTTVDESDILFKQAFLDIDDIYVDGNFIFSNKNVLSLMNEIRKCNKKYIKVKNGLVTTKNTFFIKDEFDFNEYIIKVTKGNFGNGKVWEKCFYPYDENGKIIPYEELIKNENIKKYIEENKDELLSRPNISEETFYGFGKTQGLPDTYKEKISISKMSNGSIHGIFSPSATHNLSNLYIISNSEYSISEIITMLNRQINNMIYTNDIYVQKPQNLKFNDVFISMNDIVKTIGKRRANGYYSIEGKPMENFLNYLIDKEIKETKKKQN